MRIGAWLFVSIFSAALALAQDPKVVVDVNLIQVKATVEDEQGRPVTNLEASDFQLLENGNPQEIRYFSKTNQRVAVGFVVDSSVSTRGEKRKVNEALAELVEAIVQSDETFLMTFAGRTELAVSMAPSNMVQTKKNILKAARKRHTNYGTRFYDAIVESLEYLADTSADRRALVVLSDGADHNSTHTLDQTIELARERGVEIYLIQYAGDDPLTWTQAGRDQIQHAFESLAEGSGGQTFFPRSVEENSGVSRHINQRLHHQYSLGFYSDNGLTTPENIEVTLQGDYAARFLVRRITTPAPATLSKLQ